MKLIDEFLYNKNVSHKTLLKLFDSQNSSVVATVKLTLVTLRLLKSRTLIVCWIIYSLFYANILFRWHRFNESSPAELLRLLQ